MKSKKIKFLNLGNQPFANSFLNKNDLVKKEKKFNLSICFNSNTKIVSINKPFSSKKMFNNKYPYRASMSKTVEQSFKNLSKKIKSNFKPRNILEIGSNDGSFIKFFDKRKTVGIEPCSNVEKLTKIKGFKTLARYWNNVTANYILKKFGKFDLIFSANTISHIKQLDGVLSNIYKVLNDKGTLIIEDPSLLECLKNNAYDQFYNEHIYVFSLTSINNLLKRNKLEIFDIQNIDLHGGSNRYFIKKINDKRKIKKSVFKQYSNEKKYGLNNVKTYLEFAKRVKKSKKELLLIFQNIKSKGKKIIGYGATAKSTTVLNYCGINKKFIEYFLDTTPSKQNKYTPGSKILIKKYNKGIDNDIDYAFLGAWNFKKEIFKKEKNFIKRGGKFIIHTPKPKII